ncbi:YdcF family protein [Mucilaginibacter sp. BJC16-A38]|uniref:YdcF family protein n=1 Tax=Mucilaginibacter phenanthrenivorans TaxID=1234842 RepID=UPI00215892A8|nr:YdcF family protein [Mucilaginibacter phenanthrenivorans]MCR8559777.1 YdcF family protein [Mucilaginibacter phenanthrenivorans]
MFFFFSKVLLIFILPFTWVVIFIIAAFIARIWKPRLQCPFFVTSGVILLLFSNPFLFNLFASRWDIKPVPLKQSGSYSCAIILGGFSGPDAKGEGRFNGSADRFIQGLKLLSTGKVTHLLVSGGNGNLVPGNFREGTWVKTQLELLKVPDSCIVVESQSRNTLENAAFSKTILAQKRLQPPYLLVTSAFHMRRAVGIFRKEKVDIIPYPCNYMVADPELSFDQLMPDAGILGGWNFYIKELVGNIVNYFK